MEMNYQWLFSKWICGSKDISRKYLWGDKFGVTYTHLTSEIPQKKRGTPCKPLHTNFLNIFVSIDKHIKYLKLKYKNLAINILNHAKRTISKV
jgi:hypothetical protein